jgi:hypothetical protein
MVRPMIKQCSGNGYFCDLCQHPLPPTGVVRSCGGLSHRPTEPQQAPELARHDAPSFLEKVKNFASAAVSHVAAGMPMCSDEEIIRRHDICLTCEHLQNDACNLCGCPVARVAGYVSKLSWADQECPAGKWGKAPSA